jgi:hypothetical protein
MEAISGKDKLLVTVRAGIIRTRPRTRSSPATAASVPWCGYRRRLQQLDDFAETKFLFRRIGVRLCPELAETALGEVIRDVFGFRNHGCEIQKPAKT